MIQGGGYGEWTFRSLLWGDGRDVVWALRGASARQKLMERHRRVQHSLAPANEVFFHRLCHSRFGPNWQRPKTAFEKPVRQPSLTHEDSLACIAHTDYNVANTVMNIRGHAPQIGSQSPSVRRRRATQEIRPTETSTWIWTSATSAERYTVTAEPRLDDELAEA